MSAKCKGVKLMVMPMQAYEVGTKHFDVVRQDDEINQ